MITVTYLGILKHNYEFIYLFIPNGVPKLLIPYIMIIEIISYSSRILSLAIRLTTNMIAGHVLLYILCFFGYKLKISFLSIFNLSNLSNLSNFSSFILSIISFIISFILLYFGLLSILILEIAVSIIQAYVLSVLISTYIKDSLELH